MAESKKQKTETSTENTASSASYGIPNIEALTHLAPFVQDGLDRLQALYDELASLEQTAYDRTKQMSNQLGDMWMGSLDYAAALSREWRQIGLEASRRTARMFNGA